MKEFLNEVEQNKIGKIVKNAKIKKYTTYRVGGEATALIHPKSIDKLVDLIRLIKKYNIKYKVIGNGSNLLFSDKKFDGVLIKLDALDNIKIYGTTIVVEAGYSLVKLSLLAAKYSLAGLEFAAGIPATVGGAVFMNAGAYRSDMGYIVTKVKVLTPSLEIKELTNKEMNFHYRKSFLQTHRDYICLEATISLYRGRRDALESVIKDRRKRRIESQPLEFPSAGSVFRNPEGYFAGKLIEDLNLKGKTIGGAEVSKKHANFIINRKNATAKDIKDLIEYVQKRVKDKYNIELKIEQEFVNWE